MKVDQSSTDVVQELPSPVNTSLLYFLSTQATVPNEKLISKLKYAVSGYTAESCLLLKDSQFSQAVTCQPVSRSQTADGAGHEPQATTVL